MDLKLARTELDAKPKTISIEKIEAILSKDSQHFFYFDRENTHKQLSALVEYFEERGLSVYHRTVKYGLDDNDYMYEVHIL